MYVLQIKEKKLTMIATRIPQIRKRQEITPVKMADVALKVRLALVHFLVLPLYNQSACTKIHAPSRRPRQVANCASIIIILVLFGA